MTQVTCTSRYKLTASKIMGEADLDEWLCGVELEGNVAISKKVNGVISVKSRDCNLSFCYGDWIVANEDDSFSVYSDEDFKACYEIDGEPVGD